MILAEIQRLFHYRLCYYSFLLGLSFAARRALNQPEKEEQEEEGKPLVGEFF